MSGWESASGSRCVWSPRRGPAWGAHRSMRRGPRYGARWSPAWRAHASMCRDWRRRTYRNMRRSLGRRRTTTCQLVHAPLGASENRPQVVLLEIKDLHSGNHAKGEIGPGHTIVGAAVHPGVGAGQQRLACAISLVHQNFQHRDVWQGCCAARTVIFALSRAEVGGPEYVWHPARSLESGEAQVGDRRVMRVHRDTCRPGWYSVVEGGSNTSPDRIGIQIGLGGVQNAERCVDRGPRDRPRLGVIGRRKLDIVDSASRAEARGQAAPASTVPCKLQVIIASVDA